MQCDPSDGRVYPEYFVPLCTDSGTAHMHRRRPGFQGFTTSCCHSKHVSHFRSIVVSTSTATARNDLFSIDQPFQINRGSVTPILIHIFFRSHIASMNVSVDRISRSEIGFSSRYRRKFNSNRYASPGFRFSILVIDRNANQ